MVVVREAAARFAVEPEIILSRDRHRSVAAARIWAMAECRSRYGWSYPEVGKAFERDASTAQNACNEGFRQRRNAQRRLVVSEAAG